MKLLVVVADLKTGNLSCLVTDLTVIVGINLPTVKADGNNYRLEDAAWLKKIVVGALVACLGHGQYLARVGVNEGGDSCVCLVLEE